MTDKKASDHQYYLEHKDKIKRRSKAWKKANPEKVAAQRLKDRVKDRARSLKYCRDHANERYVYRQKWGKRNPKKVRDLRLKAYSLTFDEKKERITEQQDQCSICSEFITVDTGRVDHDHRCCPSRRSCGKCLRNILCNRCNLLLGHAKDDIKVLTRAIEYLTDWSCE